MTGRKLGFDGIVNLPSIRGQMSWEPSWDRHLGSVRGLDRLCDSHPPTLFDPIITIGFIGFPTKFCKNNLLNVLGRNRAALGGLSEDNAFQFPKWCNWGSKLETIIVRFLSDRRNVNHTHLSRPSRKAKFSMKPLYFNPPTFFQTYYSTGCFCPLYGQGDPSELPNALRTLGCR